MRTACASARSSRPSRRKWATSHNMSPREQNREFLLINMTQTIQYKDISCGKRCERWSCWLCSSQADLLRCQAVFLHPDSVFDYPSVLKSLFVNK